MLDHSAAPKEASAVRTSRGLIILVSYGLVAVLGACAGADEDETGSAAVPVGSVPTEEMAGMLLTAGDVEVALANSAGPAQGSGWEVQDSDQTPGHLMAGPDCSEDGRTWAVMVEVVAVDGESDNPGTVREALITDDPETIAMLFEVERTCWMQAADDNPSESAFDVTLAVDEAFGFYDTNEGEAATEYDIFVRDGGVMLTVGIAGQPELTQEDAIAIAAAAIDKVG